ncbi:hypothetical protein LOTGIDRAFT_169116 [Lottia gigantea]|uniref:Uncharacterized protein n=1 Tax=Lottia gigantea TaxID=225164 RepID=V3ZRX7_LOTGI|nr:hypothetical protein LOTGIDRAFT_169116 [Lottia gigantea]ESO83641.1 hypothetical protein LOTGIDRAFT_169116 [Lottia gigantea]
MADNEEKSTNEMDEFQSDSEEELRSILEECEQDQQEVIHDINLDENQVGIEQPEVTEVKGDNYMKSSHDDDLNENYNAISYILDENPDGIEQSGVNGDNDIKSSQDVDLDSNQVPIKQPKVTHVKGEKKQGFVIGRVKEASINLFKLMIVNNESDNEFRLQVTKTQFHECCI